VRDEGTGMSDDVQARLFQPFFTTKGDRGSGLGLSVCRNIAKRHGGKLAVQSAPGAGATFTLSLPPAPAEIVEPTPSGRELRRSVQGAVCQILLIDDQEEVRESVGEMLRALGHQVVVAPDGPAGLSLASGKRLDVVLTDFGMPGMNGVEFAQRLRVVAPQTPVVLITGWGLDPGTLTPDNVAFVLGKPITMQELGDALAACSADEGGLDTRGIRCS
jgi:two-component system cell cycle sensor histidine kinase/response regulator CckA